MKLCLDEVTVEIAGQALIRELCLEVEAAEIVGVVGPNGSGKSTALRCVYRALRPTAGTVWLGGTDVSALSRRRSARSVAAMTQENHTDLDFTVDEVVALGRAPHLRGNQSLSARERGLCQWAMRQTEVEHLRDRSVLTLSGGERQRVLLARALVQEPSVLVLDEPTNHLDMRHQVDLLSFLRAAGRTVLVALHDLNMAAAVCDRIAVLDRGGLVTTGTPEHVLTTGLVRDVFKVDVTVVPHPRTGVPQLLHEIHETVTAFQEGTAS